jgi:hypothetical protein
MFSKTGYYLQKSDTSLTNIKFSDLNSDTVPVHGILYFTNSILIVIKIHTKHGSAYVCSSPSVARHRLKKNKNI